MNPRHRSSQAEGETRVFPGLRRCMWKILSLKHDHPRNQDFVGHVVYDPGGDHSFRPFGRLKDTIGYPEYHAKRRMQKIIKMSLSG